MMDGAAIERKDNQERRIPISQTTIIGKGRVSMLTDFFCYVRSNYCLR